MSMNFKWVGEEEKLNPPIADAVTEDTETVDVVADAEPDPIEKPKPKRRAKK